MLVDEVRSVWYVFWEVRLKVDSQLDLLLLRTEEAFDLPIVLFMSVTLCRWARSPGTEGRWEGSL